jgi:class 3 adenylate cyclase/tetratricopeptide (TPR) repeat protein
LICRACGAEVAASAKFCTECGAEVLSLCPSCGVPHPREQKFCGECGAQLTGATSDQAPADTDPDAAAAGALELRLVSVLFIDLVGFTTLSEAHDAEDVRDLLAGYFESARTIVGRYGGTIEKFIGDAVMAVWGTPVAREDDAERAVRAGLELVDAVSAFGERVGMPELRARGGITTGQVVSVDNPGEGLVVGDRVNTAARAQSAAEPGNVVVDDVTHEVTCASIAFEDAGEHAVKGKAAPLHLWRAMRVVAGVGGAQRERALEGPLIGRDTDLRLLKDLFHGALERGGARLVAISAAAGVGKSRLLWEFDKYADGLAEPLLWHSGRCLSYGDGVAYWALGEMVRQRLGIAADASAAETLARLAAGLDRWVPDPGDREFVEPRLGALLAVAEPGLARADLFAGWRLFFDRLAEHLPVVLVFEDLQWADEGLLDFIEHMLDWSAASPIFMLTLARPEFASSREAFPLPAGRRGATLLQLEPLEDAQMGTLLDGLVEGLPAQVRTRIIERAEGVPLYAIETVRVLAARGALDDRDGRLTLSGELGDLDIPASLSSLLAARLDALEPNERRLVKAMAVFGGSFPRSSAVALGEVPEDQLDTVLAALVRKQILRIRADPLSPDRGQYSFVQGLLRVVAYEMLSRRERMPRHRAAADYLRSAFPNDGEDVAEVIASHYLDAYRAARGDDAPELGIETIAALRRAARRQAAVGTPESAERAYLTASELTSEESERTELILAAGEMALQAGRFTSAIELFDISAAAHSAAGREAAAARVAGQIGRALSRLGRNEEAIDRIAPALQVLGAEQPDSEVAILHAVLGHAHLFAGHYDAAGPSLETAARIATELGLPEVLSSALIDKGLICLQNSEPEQARSRLGEALAIAERHDLVAQQMLARGNSGTLATQWDMSEAADQHQGALALARRQGDRFQESVAAANLIYTFVLLGRWDEAEQLATEVLDGFEDRPGVEFVHYGLAILRTRRGELDAARSSFDRMAGWQTGDDEELRALYASVAVRMCLAEGRCADALEQGSVLVGDAIRTLATSNESVRNAWPDTLEAAVEMGRIDTARELLGSLSDQPAEHVPPFLHLQLVRGRALAAAADGEEDEAIEVQLSSAADGFRSLGYPYWVARTQVDLAAWLVEQQRGGDAGALVGEAAEVLRSLGAEPALTRASQLDLSGSIG